MHKQANKKQQQRSGSNKPRACAQYLRHRTLFQPALKREHGAVFSVGKFTTRAIPP